MFLREFFLFEGLTSVNRDKLANLMATSVVTGQYWDKEAIKKKPNLAELWEVAYSMLEWFGDELPDHVKAMDEADRFDTPEFHAVVLRWAYARFDRAMKKLLAVPKVKGGYLIHRAIRTPLDGLLRPGKTISLGVYWTYDLDAWEGDFRPVWANDDDPGEDLVINAWVDPSSVDWETTVMANMDWFSGDIEAEIRLFRNADVTVRGITDYHEDEDWSNLDLSRIRFVA